MEKLAQIFIGKETKKLETMVENLTNIFFSDESNDVLNIAVLVHDVRRIPDVAREFVTDQCTVIAHGGLISKVTSPSGNTIFMLTNDMHPSRVRGIRFDAVYCIDGPPPQELWEHLKRQLKGGAKISIDLGQDTK